jgi:hypothetical protein
MDELFPIGAGLIFGIAFAANFRILRPWWVKAILVVTAGASATILSGEYVENWGFILVDLGEVALAAWIAAYLCRMAARRLRSRKEGRQIASSD